MSPLTDISNWDVPRAAAAVIDRSGVRDRHGPIDDEFALASVTKVLFALAVHVAVEEAVLTLDAPAGPPGSTVAHLLAHASGLGPDDADRSMAEPGTRRIYSNAGFEVLADTLAASAGMSAERYVAEALVEFFGLAGTSVTGSPAHAYRSSVADLATVLTGVVSGGLLAASTLAALTSPAFPDLAGVLPGYGRQDPNPWGLGVEVRGAKSPHWTAPENSPDTWGHFGRAGTFLWWDPVADLGLIVLTDREFGPWAIDAWPRLSSAVLHRHG